MKKRAFELSILTLLVVIALALAGARPVRAQEAGDEIEIAGTVVSVDEENGRFTVENEAGETFTVIATEGFDFSTLQAGDWVEVEGTLDADGAILADTIEVEGQDDGDDDDDDDDDGEDGEDGDGTGDPSNGYYCTNPETPHPFGARLAARYEVEYATLLEWFCDGYGWGQVMLALQTGQISGDDPGVLLEARSSGQGWGQIWQELGLIGRPEDAGPPDSSDGGQPDLASPPGDRGGGRPESAGPPSDRGGGRPDFAGPPSDRGNDQSNPAGPPSDRGNNHPNPGGPPNGHGGGRPEFAGPPERSPGEHPGRHGGGKP